MNFYQTLLTAIRELSLHKFRSGLATLGVIFGVASVMAMLSISEGARLQTMQRIAILGVDNLLIRTVRPKMAAGSAPDGSVNSAKYGLERQDLEHYRKTFGGLKYAVGAKFIRERVYPVAGRKQTDTKVLATEPEYLTVTRTNIERGRFILPADMKEKRMVCVIGVDAARAIFSFGEPMGETLRIGDDYYEVVGLLRNSANLKDAGGDDINNMIFIPLATANERYGDLFVQENTGSYEYGRIELDTILLQLQEESDVEATADRAKTFLDRTHKRQDYDLLVPRDLLSQKAATQRIFTVVMGSIASISLIVGGIGIMNIMLANVSDRRREIGTRRALGARKLDIVRQFLLEAATLTTLGGGVGVMVGYVLSRTISSYADWPVVIAPMSILAGLGVSCASGIVFGFWPAWQAAKVNPIEALRSS